MFDIVPFALGLSPCGGGGMFVEADANMSPNSFLLTPLSAPEDEEANAEAWGFCPCGGGGIFAGVAANRSCGGGGVGVAANRYCGGGVILGVVGVATNKSCGGGDILTPDSAPDEVAGDIFTRGVISIGPSEEELSLAKKGLRLRPRLSRL